MGILQKIFGGANKKGVVKAPFTSIFSRYGGNGYGPMGSKDFLREYRNFPFACVQARAEEVGNIKLKLFKGHEEVLNHPLLDLLNRVNPSLTRNDLFEQTQAFKDLNGNCFWYLARDGKDGKGQIQEIYLLKPDKVRIIINKQNPLLVEGYLFTGPDGQIIPFTAADILHHRNFDPRAYHPYPHKGMGIIEAAAYAIDTDNEARTWNLNFFRNSARPDGILTSDSESVMDADQYKRIKEEWDEEHKGSDNAHKISVLSGGLKYQELTRSQKEMDFLGQRTFSRDEILALFRVPKSIIGITDDVNRANAEATVYVFALRTITPLMQKMINTLNEFLLPAFGGMEDYRLDFVSPVPLDRSAMAEEFVKGHNVWLSTNDIRRQLGLPVTPEGEKLYQLDNLIAVDSTPVPEAQKSIKEKPQKKGRKAEEKKEKSSVEKMLDNFIAGKLPPTKQEENALLKTGLDADAKTAHIDAWKKRIANTSPLKKKVREFFAKQEKEVQKNLREEMRGLDAKEFQYKAVEDVLFDYDKSVAASISFITPFISQYIKESGDIGNAAADGDGFDVEERRVQEFIPKRAKYFAETINDTTREDLLNSIQQGIDAQEDLSQISQRVADVYGKATDFRTDMIARTEAAASSNFGSIQGYLQAGIEEHQWIVVDPEDEDCKENDGVIVKIGDPFPDGDIDPPVHPNCQCTTIPIFPDDKKEEE